MDGYFLANTPSILQSEDKNCTTFELDKPLNDTDDNSGCWAHFKWLGKNSHVVNRLFYTSYHNRNTPYEIFARIFLACLT